MASGSAAPPSDSFRAPLKNDLRSVLTALRHGSPVVLDVSAELRYVLLKRYVEASMRNGRLGVWTFLLMLFGLGYEAPFAPRLAGTAVFVGMLLWRLQRARRWLRRLSPGDLRPDRTHDLLVVAGTAAWPVALYLLAPWMSPPNVFGVLYISLVVLAVLSLAYFSALPVSVVLIACCVLPLAVFILRQQTFVSLLLATSTVICAGAVLAGVRRGHETLLQALAAERENAALVAELQHYRQQLENENASLGSSLRDASDAASRDPLTGLFNRRHLAAYAEPLTRLVDGAIEDIAICMIDIDHFKRINDRHGHAVGDEVLRAVGGLLGARLRDRDCLARFGGEEFVIVLRRCDIHRARRVAEALRQNIASAGVETEGGEVAVTVSFGVAQWAAGEPVDSAIARADRSLYRAKLAGRDRVEVDVDDARRFTSAGPDSTLPSTFH